MDYNDLVTNGKALFRSRIDGDFEGFDDGKLFPLINGQYWLQNTYKYWYRYSYRPAVTIIQYKQSTFLTIDGQNRFVEIKLLQDVIKATITNDFRGWSGDTHFELDNGQIWKQSEYDYHYNYSYRPPATIYSDGYNHKILVEGKSVAVKRLK